MTAGLLFVAAVIVLRLFTTLHNFMEKVEAAKIAEQRADKELAGQILRLADHWIRVAAILEESRRSAMGSADL